MAEVVEPPLVLEAAEESLVPDVAEQPLVLEAAETRLLAFEALQAFPTIDSRIIMNGVLRIGSYLILGNNYILFWQRYLIEKDDFRELHLRLKWPNFLLLRITH